MAASLGSVDSLVMPPQLLQPGDLSPALAIQSGITSGTVRLSFGLEDVTDLKQDLAQALAAVAAE